MKKHAILMTIIYIVSLSMNVMPSLKYPDSSLSLVNLLASLMLMLAIVFWFKSLMTVKKLKVLKIISTIGMVSSICIFLISWVEHMTYEIFILDIILGIQYPLYLLFVTPLFGMNYIFNSGYGIFSGIASLFYLAVFLLCLFCRRK